MLNLSDETFKFCTVTMLLIVNMYLFHSKFVDVSVIYLYTKFHILCWFISSCY